MVKYLKQAPPRRPEDRAEVVRVVSEILRRVQQEGEPALREYSQRFDGWNPPSFRVSEAEIEQAAASLDPAVKRDIDFSLAQVRNFATLQLQTMQGFEAETQPGVILGQKHIPVASVGSYVPGGRYPLVASAYMSIATPKVAGVKRVIACTPPIKGQAPYAASLYAMHAAGADDIYCMGGAQALAAMAFGTAGIAPVDMVVGPGNRFVAEAKRQLFGPVGIDFLAGPTEILVIADDSADPELVAGDLVGQAEHGPDSPAILITTSAALGAAVMAEVERQLRDLPTGAVASVAWRDYGAVAVVDSDAEAAALSDQYAPEHLEVQTRNLDWYLENVHNYGSLFLGEHATVAYADKVIGTNHILPTAGAARYTGGLWVGKFLKTVTYQRVTRQGGELIAPISARQCRLEGMEAHARTADQRIRRYR